MTALIASFLVATNATAHELVAACRATIPSDVELEGRIVLRNRRGIPQAEYSYALKRHGGETDLAVMDGDGAAVQFAREGNLLKTDVTWSDLALDYLWWDDVSFDAEREGETVNGQVCAVIVMKKDGRTVRAWVDRKTGALMQAEELRDGKPVRRLWGTRLKKFGDRWMAHVLEVETMGAGHRTKITVEKLK